MSTEPAVNWTPEKQAGLVALLTGRWEEDVWSFPSVRRGRGPVTLRFRFVCRSAGLNLELKYALWRKFDRGEWQLDFNDQSMPNVLAHLVRWLDETAPEAGSLLDRPLIWWETSLRSWLVALGRYHQRSFQHLQADQSYREHRLEDTRVRLLRQIYATVRDAYDDREEFDKDVWDMRRLGLTLNPSVQANLLNFTPVNPPWLRRLAKEFLRYNLAVYTPGDSLNKLRVFGLFGRFSAGEPRLRGVADLDRRAVTDFIGWMVAEGYDDRYRRNALVMLRTIFTACAHELQIPDFPAETLVLGSDLPKERRALPREIPEEVLDQLRRHLGALPVPALRMVVILLECGMRISELCTLRRDCLLRDDRGRWSLRLYQWKGKQEHVIPLVDEEVVAAIQAQQQDVRERRGETTEYLFPRPSDAVQPYLQGAFAQALNKWALEHDIRDREGVLWRFQSHQFRHTVGMRLINDDVPLEVIARLFGHGSLLMTQRYARKRAEKVREELERVRLGRRTVDYRGQQVSADPAANDPDVELVRRGIRGQTLPLGGCGRLLVRGPCEHANKCLTCPFWLTSTDDLPGLKGFRDRAVQLRAKAAEAGNEVVLSNQDRIVPNLEVRIAALEAPSGEPPTVPALVDALRIELAEVGAALDEAHGAGLVLSAKQLERSVLDLRNRLRGLEQTREGEKG